MGRLHARSSRPDLGSGVVDELPAEYGPLVGVAQFMAGEVARLAAA
jgi:hypothetical protein